MLSEEVRKEARKFTIKNAFDYGRAKPGPVISKLLSIYPELKQDVAGLSKEIAEIVGEVNKLSAKDLNQEFSEHRLEFEVMDKEKAERTAKPKMIIEGAEEGKVVTRFPPEPGGYITIGNAKQCILSAEFAKIYSGKIYLYFDDTNPEKSKQEFVNSIKDDLKWLGVNFSREYYASDYIETVYGSGKRLLRQGDAYVCMCSGEDVKKSRVEKKECKHRNQLPEDNLVRFEEMLMGRYDEGQAIVRLKGDMSSENATFRDPTLFRVKKAEHYRQGKKYSVWPTYHINTPVIDNLNGVTDVIRGKEYEIWDEINKKMLVSLGLKPPRMHYEARLKIEGAAEGKRVVRKLLKDGDISGWNDPRLVTIAALRRRGIRSEAIWAFVLRFGMSKTDSVVSLDMLLSENKKLIDPIAKHLFFVKDPVKLVVNGASHLSVKLRLHPTNDSNFREYETAGEFYIGRDDAKTLKKGDLMALKDLCMVKILLKGRKFITAEPASSKKRDKIIQWVSEKDYVGCSVLVPENLLGRNGEVRTDSLKVWKGYVESYATKLKEHDVVQFERVGYCILDRKKGMQFILTSR